MPRLPAKQREAEKISTQLPNGSYAATAHDAPCRHAFDAHADSLLASLRGDKRKRKQTLESFISTLKSKREEFRKEKKTGAGSATEAIEFYEYALDKNSSWKGNNEGGSRVSEDKTDCKATCKICNQVGHLIHCSQPVCENYFHLHCVRPILDEDPPSDWNCAYCDVNYVTGLKPQARKRRVAVSAVRAMEKARLDIKSGKIHPEEYNAELKKRKADEMNSSGGEMGVVRSQRQRRSKVIFDPQGSDTDDASPALPPALKEQPQMIDKDEIPIDILKRLSPKSINANSKHGQFHCKYCMDDETTETCCFCACRVCFSKHERDRTILCDICDAEYHMDCLSPPLKQLPDHDWYCPTCIQVITKLQNDPKRGKKLFNPSMPAKDNPKSAKKTKISKSSISALKATHASKQPRLPCGRFAPKNFAPPDKPVKRGPGRPPKSASKQNPIKKTGTGRPRGRPPKNANALSKLLESKKDKETNAAITSESKSVTPKKRGRGRPPSVSKIAKGETKVKNEVCQVEGKIPEKSSQVSTCATSSMIEQVSIQFPSNDANTTTVKSFQKDGIEAKKSEAKSSANEINVKLQEKLFLQNNKEPMNIIAIKNATAAAISAVGRRVEAKSDTVHPKLVLDGTFSKIGSTSQTANSTSPTNHSSANNERGGGRVPRRKPGARECMQISRRFGANVISQQYMETLLDYCTRGKVEHLIRMRERLDDHARTLELQLAGLEMMIEEKGGVEPGQSTSEEQKHDFKN